MTAPGTRQNASQMESRRPSSCAAPSIWNAAVAAPNRKFDGNSRAETVMRAEPSLVSVVTVRSSSALDRAGHDAAHELPAGEGEQDEERDRRQQHAGEHDRVVDEVVGLQQRER